MPRAAERSWYERRIVRQDESIYQKIEMTERGGPTNQSGIFYQNSVAALYLGRLCDAVERPDADSVVEVRTEAPEDVDDTVATYADDHRKYIKPKRTSATTAPRGATCGKTSSASFGYQISGETRIGCCCTPASRTTSTKL